MQAAANQVRWVAAEEIVIPGGEWEDPSPDGGVHVAAMADGRYQLLSGSQRLRRMREAGQVCADVIISPTECMEERISRLLDQPDRSVYEFGAAVRRTLTGRLIT